MSSASQIVTEFLTAFLSGDNGKAASMLSSDFSFKAPLLQESAGKAAYFAGAEEKAKYVRKFRILRQWESGNEVSTLYELDIETPAGTATMLLSDWHTIRNGEVASILMVFDSAADGVRLIANALTSNH